MAVESELAAVRSEMHNATAKLEALQASVADGEATAAQKAHELNEQVRG